MEVPIIYSVLPDNITYPFQGSQHLLPKIFPFKPQPLIHGKEPSTLFPKFPLVNRSRLHVTCFHRHFESAKFWKVAENWKNDKQ
jgi:hypothetical protein